MIVNSDINILFIDDEVETLHAMRRFLRGESYATHFASSGQEALELCDRIDIAVVITDLRMPGMSGLELIENLKKRYPEFNRIIIRMILSGTEDIGLVIDAINTGQIFRFIPKPVDPLGFRSIINDAIEYYQLLSERKQLITLLNEKNRALKKNVDELHRMTELLKQSEMQFRAMNDAAFDPIFLVSASGFFVYANQAAQDLLGYGVNEFPALKFTGITSVCGMEDAAAGTMSSGADILSGDAYRSRQETLFVTKDGTLVNVEITTGRVSINSTIYTVITARDNTLRINEEKSRLKLEKIQKTFETQIDNTLLQGRIPDNLDGVSIGRFMISSGNLNGDFTEFIVYDNRHADILLGDVMGHGMLSALVGAGLKSRYLKMLAQQKKRGCDDIPELLDVMRDLHDDCIGNLIDLEIYVTLLLVRIDLEEMRFSMIDCGHTPTIHYQAGSDRCKLVKGPNPAVGMVERQEYRQVSFPLEEKDMIVLYSDGITESRMPDGSFFGQERLLDLVLQNKCCSPVAMAETIRTSVLTETGSENVEDDVTCIVIRIGSSTE